jgi:hypothetical protein
MVKSAEELRAELERDIARWEASAKDLPDGSPYGEIRAQIEEWLVEGRGIVAALSHRD